MKFKTYHKQLTLDTHTPVSAYLSVRDKFVNSILLESSDHNSREGNYSIIACKPISTFKVLGTEIQITNGKNIATISLDESDLKTELTKFIKSFETESIQVQFPYSAVFGYSSFDSIPLVEKISFSAKGNCVIPEVYYSFYSLLLVFDHAQNRLHIVSFADTIEEASFEAFGFENILDHSIFIDHVFETIGDVSSTTDDKNFLKQVEKAKLHCQLGDIFQLVLSKRFTRNFIGDEFNVYRTLKQINPSPYLFFFDLGSFKIFGSSPEAQLIVKNSIAEIHPIAGTYKRTQNEDEDLLNAQKLDEDPKENAEHMMLVDLARNDLSKCCTDVKVESLKKIQFFSHVIHLISKVTGKLRKDISSIDLLYSSFPAGTLSGAPKFKAMELIDVYEPVSRNFYGGCIGYIETNGNINHAIAIRSFLSLNNQLHFQAGAGIVVNSDPESELKEIYNKVGALKKALEEANKLNIITNFTIDENFSTR